jgi:hypothetical protein
LQWSRRETIAAGSVGLRRSQASFPIGKKVEDARRSANTITELGECLGDRTRAQLVQMLGTALEAKLVERGMMMHGDAPLLKRNA